MDLDTSKISVDAENYIVEGKTFIGSDYEDESDIKVGKLKIRTQNDLVSKIDQNNSFIIPKGYYASNYNIIIPSIKDYTSSQVAASASDVFEGFNVYINGDLVTGTGKVGAVTSVQRSAVYSVVGSKSFTLSWSYPSNSFISGVAVCIVPKYPSTTVGGDTITGPYTFQRYMGSASSYTYAISAPSSGRSVVAKASTRTNTKPKDYYYYDEYLVHVYPYCIINNSYKWYNKNGTVIPSFTGTIQCASKYQSSYNSGGGCDSYGGGTSCGDSCGCNNNCNHVSYGVFC